MNIAELLAPDDGFRSQLERDWAATLDALWIVWDYEPERVTLRDGRGYIPDFWLPDLRTWLEVKGPGVAGLDKTKLFAREIDALVVVGFVPEFAVGMRSALRGRYAGAIVGVRFGMCPECSRRQWLDALACRVCSASIPVGCLYPVKDMPFRTKTGRFGGTLCNERR
jgi:hypothetical protein